MTLRDWSGPNKIKTECDFEIPFSTGMTFSIRQNSVPGFVPGSPYFFRNTKLFLLMIYKRFLLFLAGNWTIKKTRIYTFGKQ